jgi:hypothetical protein
MRWPWERLTRTDTERAQAEARTLAVRSHIRILVRELETTLDRIAEQAASHER